MITYDKFGNPYNPFVSSIEDQNGRVWQELLKDSNGNIILDETGRPIFDGTATINKMKDAGVYQ